MANEICIGLDLGSDTLKIAYASGSDKCGKFLDDKHSLNVAVPAVAYYDRAAGKWIYGDGVDSGERSFINVVKIKALISMLIDRPDAPTVVKKNREYYADGSRFPKFCFPARRKMLDDFGEMVRRDLTFDAPGFTPRSVCEGYFSYIAEVVSRNITELTALKGAEKCEKIRLALVYPAVADKAYIAEYTRLAENAFGIKADKVMSFTKALSMYAYGMGMVSRNESLLIFDMGEDVISVAKASVIPSAEGARGSNGDELVVDGSDGHSEPLAVGGNDIDRAVAEYIRGGIEKRETVGYPSYGDPGHISETWLHSKLYLFMKEIKAAKVILSAPGGGSGLFADGVPVSVNCDLYIERKLTREELCRCIGVTDGSGVAREIADYILGELRRSVNKGVSKVFLSGGLTETYALADFIKEQVAREFPGLRFYPVDSDGTEENDGFTILRNEDSVYAPAAGAAIAAYRNYDIRAVLALSYGTWVDFKDQKLKLLALFVDRGTPPDAEGEYKTEFTVHGEKVPDEEIFSTVITRRDIRSGNYPGLRGDDMIIYDNEPYLVIGERGSAQRKRVAAAVELCSVKKDEILYWHNGARVHITEGSVSCCEGMRITPEGRAKPFVRNDETGYSRIVGIKYLGKPRRQDGTTDFSVDISRIYHVYAKDVVVGFKDGAELELSTG